LGGSHGIRGWPVFVKAPDLSRKLKVATTGDSFFRAQDIGELAGDVFRHVLWYVPVIVVPWRLSYDMSSRL
jgi:hypothetical protein